MLISAQGLRWSTISLFMAHFDYLLTVTVTLSCSLFRLICNGSIRAEKESCDLSYFNAFYIPLANPLDYL